MILLSFYQFSNPLKLNFEKQALIIKISWYLNTLGNNKAVAALKQLLGENNSEMKTLLFIIDSIALLQLEVKF